MKTSQKRTSCIGTLCRYEFVVVSILYLPPPPRPSGAFSVVRMFVHEEESAGTVG